MADDGTEWPLRRGLKAHTTLTFTSIYLHHTVYLLYMYTMCTSLCLCMSSSIYLLLSIYLFIYLYLSMSISICIYFYIYIIYLYVAERSSALPRKGKQSTRKGASSNLSEGNTTKVDKGVSLDPFQMAAWSGTQPCRRDRLAQYPTRSK